MTRAGDIAAFLRTRCRSSTRLDAVGHMEDGADYSRFTVIDRDGVRWTVSVRRTP